MSTTAQTAMDFISTAIASGRTVYVSTMTRCTAISPATFNRWEKSGIPLFKFSSDGNLLMASGKVYGRITSGDILLVGIKAI